MRLDGERTFAVTEVFRTLQGEGYHAGTPAIFVRFAGCNMWSGREHDRERDARRHRAQCPRFCDTDFSPRYAVSEAALCRMILDAMAGVGIDLLVLTGGEPGLQVTHSLVTRLKRTTGARVSMETNGTVNVNELGLDWITVSPKQDDTLLQARGDELKVIVPRYDPLSFLSVLYNFDHLFVQPEDSERAEENMRAAVDFVLAHPEWRLSLQTQKVLNIP